MTATTTATTKPTKSAKGKGKTATKSAAPQQPALPPVPADVLAECLPTAPGKTVLVDLATCEVVKAAKPKAKAGLSGNMLATLEAMKDGKAMTHTAIAAVTGRDKGNKLRELTAAGLVTTTEQTGGRGYLYCVTDAGKAALTNAGKPEATQPPQPQTEAK